MIHYFPLEQIHVSPDRQRKHFDGAKIMELANSIQSVGLLQPIVIEIGGALVAGERRTRACKHLAAMGVPIRFGDDTLPYGNVPVVFYTANALKTYEAQLDENIRREDLSWQERAAATEFLHALRTRQNADHGISETTREGTDSNVTRVRDQLIVAKHLEDKEISSAPSVKDAMKILQKREEKSRLTRLSESVNVKTLSSLHRLECCDFRCASVENGTIDVILTDPPYGMGAQAFKDGGGAVEVMHEYNDMDGADWRTLMIDFAKWSWHVTKAKAHLYLFCDIDQYHWLRDLIGSLGWRVHRTPLVYSKSHASSRRVPWPTMGPRRGYELVLYAVKGDRSVNAIVSDVFSADTDENLGHAAQKPVGAYTNLLRRSVAAGDVVCDPFCGTGTIFPAAQECKCRAIGFELDPAFHGIAIERLEVLK
jgi:site-specific DNA-methyltransferase (adenine-specific)